MRLLIASEVSGRFSKVAVIKATKDGRRVTVGRLAGSLAAVAAKQAARFLAVEDAAQSVFYDFNGTRFRVDRI